MSKIALIMVGLPGCGKSTFISSFDFMNLNIKGLTKGAEDYFMVLSTDDYIDAVAEAKGLTYSEAFKDNIKDAEVALKERLKIAVEQDYTIIWDQTNLRKKKRATIINSIPNDYHKVAIEFDVPFDIISERVKHRAEQTGKHIGYNILKSMCDSREPVSADEGFDEHIIIKNGTE